MLLKSSFPTIMRMLLIVDRNIITLRMLFVLVLLFIYRRNIFFTWKGIELQFMFLLSNISTKFQSFFLSILVSKLLIFQYFYVWPERISKHPHQLFWFHNTRQRIYSFWQFLYTSSSLNQFYFNYWILGEISQP